MYILSGELLFCLCYHPPSDLSTYDECMSKQNNKLSKIFFVMFIYLNKILFICWRIMSIRNTVTWRKKGTFWFSMGRYVYFVFGWFIAAFRRAGTLWGISNYLIIGWIPFNTVPMLAYWCQLLISSLKFSRVSFNQEFENICLLY